MSVNYAEAHKKLSHVKSNLARGLAGRKDLETVLEVLSTILEALEALEKPKGGK